MIEQIVKELASYGIIGVLLGWLILKDWKLTIRMFQVIENNTKSMTDLKGIISSLEKTIGQLKGN